MTAHRTATFSVQIQSILTIHNKAKMIPVDALMFLSDMNKTSIALIAQMFRAAE